MIGKDNMVEIKKHLEKLGYKGRDRVTGFKGVISTIGFDLYGCIQASLTPEVSQDGKAQDGHWFDIARLEITSKKRVIDMPNFDYGKQAEGRQGAAEKQSWK